MKVAKLDAAMRRAERALGLPPIEDETPEALNEFEAIGALMLRLRQLSTEHTSATRVTPSKVQVNRIVHLSAIQKSTRDTSS